VRGPGLPQIRRALDRVSKRLRLSRPLAEARFATVGVRLYVEHIAELVGVDKDGQLAMRDTIGAYFRRIERDPVRVSVKLYPFTRKEPAFDAERTAAVLCRASGRRPESRAAQSGAEVRRMCKSWNFDQNRALDGSLVPGHEERLERLGSEEFHATMRFTTKLAATSLAVLLTGATHAASRPDQPVYRAAVAGRAGELELLKSVVDIDSGSGDVAGGERVESILAERLKAAGAEVRAVPPEIAGVAPNVVAVFHGTGKARVLIIAHIDTVFGPGTVAKRPFRIEGNRAYGPGVGDEKGGAVTAVTALEILHHLGFRDYATVTLLLDGSEELGSPGSTELIKTLARRSDVEFNMEPGDPPDALTVWRKGAGEIVIEVRGRAAHAGMVPEKGRNAAVELVHQLAALQGAFPQSGTGTTVNLTVMKAGDRSNIIPDFAEATFDVRVRKLSDFQGVLAQIKSRLAPKIVPDTAITVAAEGSTYPPLIENAEVDALGKRAQRIYAELGRRATLSGNGGASESAVAMSVGVPALDGLGLVGAGFHTDREWIDLSSVTPRLYLFTRLLIETCRAMKGKIV